MGVYKLFDMAYTIGVSPQVPAPAANAWKSVAVLLDEGLSNLPKYSSYAMLAGAIAGVALPLLSRHFRGTKYALFIPSGSSLGLSFIVMPSQSTTIFIGSMFGLWWKNRYFFTYDNYM